MPKWGRRVDVGGGIALGVVSRDVSAWILAFARMTNSGGPEVWLDTANWHGGFCHAPPRPQRGTSPRATFSHSALGHRSTIRHDFAGGEPASRLIGGHIPDRSPGHALVPIAHAGCRRHTQGMKIGLRWLVEVSWVWLVPPFPSGFPLPRE